MTIQERKKNLEFLGKFLSQFTSSGIIHRDGIPFNDLFFEPFSTLIKRAHEQNGWFTQENILYATGSWAQILQPEKIDKWFKMYDFNQLSQPKNVGVVMAGNIPLVGFHDFISVLMSGNRVKAKLSSNDKLLLPMLAKYMEHVQPKFKDYITFVSGKLENIDAVIATGSDNTARYFDYYFGKYPHIIRHNRNAVAVLTGTETEAQLSGLTDDIMLYFGLGCRNVSKLFVPVGYDFNKIFKAFLKYKDLINYQKYANNYDYNKAVYLMSVDRDVRDSLIDNALVLLKKDVHYSAPIGVVFYEFYNRLDDVQKIINQDVEKIQVVVGSTPKINSIPFGSTQIPQLWDYADGVDVIQFLLAL